MSMGTVLAFMMAVLRCPSLMIILRKVLKVQLLEYLQDKQPIAVGYFLLFIEEAYDGDQDLGPAVQLQQDGLGKNAVKELGIDEQEGVRHRRDHEIYNVNAGFVVNGKLKHSGHSNPEKVKELIKAEM